MSPPAAESRPVDLRKTLAVLWEQLSTLLIAIAIALGIRAFVIEPFRIPSGSMLPTLLIGDHLFVNKFVYGAKIPFSDLRLPALRKPARGDVVVFTVGKDESGQTCPLDRCVKRVRSEEFVKRIIGLPGDRIEIRGLSVRVNGKSLETRPLDERFTDERAHELDVLEVEVEGGKRFRILDDRNARQPDPPPFEVPEGRYYMLGDNRDHSHDSRYWRPAKTIGLAELKGPAWRLYWSWDWNGSWKELLNPIKWVQLIATKVRWDRLGDRVQ